MIYRENGQFKTTYAADQQILPIAQDRWFMAGLIVFAYIVLPLVASDYLFRALIVPFLILAIATGTTHIRTNLPKETGLDDIYLKGPGEFREIEVHQDFTIESDGAVHVSLDRSMHDGDEHYPAPAETLASEVQRDIDDYLTIGQELDVLREAILMLKEQERIVLSLYYFEELKLHEIASVLEVTESRVSQIRAKAVSKLRRELSSLRSLVA